MLSYTPGPTGQKFLDGRGFIKGIMGPVGGGKSTVCLMDLVRRSIEQEPFNNIRRTKHVILRNTIAQLKATVKPMMDTWLVMMTDGTMGSWRLSENVFEARFRLPDYTIVHAEFVLMAADTPDDVRRLLSLECSSAWVEEAREVDPEVFAGLQGRVNRFPSRIAGGVTYPGVIFSTNPPPRGGFWHDLISKEQKGVEIYLQPPAILEDGSLNPDAENLNNLAPDYYENLLAGKTEDWINVYLKNQFGAGDLGRPIYKGTFKSSFHVATSKLSPIAQTYKPMVVGMDNGLQAAAVFGQQDARGRVNLLGECYVPEDETMGVETFLRRLLVPYITEKFPGWRRDNFIFVLDPACFTRSQVDEKTIAQAVMNLGFKVTKASTNDPERRIQAVEGLLTQQIDGGPAFLVDAECSHIIDTLEWGHRYKKTASGTMTMTADKTHHSHCFVAGTPVLTTAGQVPIERVTCDHEVLTPGGAKPVVATMSHVSRDLVELIFDNGTTLVCTADHPFFTGRGIVEANALDYTDVLFTSGEPACHKPNTPSTKSTESGFTASPRGTTKLTTKSTAACTCTGTCGSGQTDPYQTDTTFTTSTASSTTTALKTLSASPLERTAHTTGWSTTAHRTVAQLLSRLWKKVGRQQPSGTAAKQGWNCTPGLASKAGSGSSAVSSNARTVGGRTSATPTWSSEVSAPQRVKPQPASNLGWTMRPDSALPVAATSGSTGTGKPAHAARLVGKRSLPGQSAKVYDLTVLDEHCFYAGDILVSNCGDAIQYLALHYNAQGQGEFFRRGTQVRQVKPAAYRYC